MLHASHENRTRKSRRLLTFCIVTTFLFYDRLGTGERCPPDMYSNDYDDGTLMNSYIKWSKRLARLHQRTLRIYQENEYMHRNDEESEEVKADEEFCWKCRGETADTDGNVVSFPHIQDLCPADRRRIAQLVKQLIKCTKEMRDAKSELAVSESEKDAMKSQYRKSLDRREIEKQQLELQLNQARVETNELKARISRILELLTQQITAQEKQFLELTKTVRDLVQEKSRLQNALADKQTETVAERSRDTAGKVVHQGCQTEEPEITAISVQEEFDKEPISYRSQNIRVKKKNDLNEPSTEGTLLRELFFRKPSVEESGTLDIIPVLSTTDLQTKRSTSILFP